MPIKAWVSRHPILAYIILVMLWSWGLWSFLFLFIKPGGLMHNPPPLSFIFVVLGGIGPSLSGVVLTRVIYGREGLRALWQRVHARCVGWWWLTLLIIPAVTAIMPLIRVLLGYPVDANAMLGLIAPGLGIGITAGLMEEFGWRGFLLPHLVKRYSPFVSTIILGLIWGGLWHGYADYFGLGDKGLYFWPIMLLLGPALLTAWSLILTWVFERTQGNMLLSILLHAGISSSAFILGQTYATLNEELVWTCISVGIAWVVTLAIWMFTHRISRKRPGEFESGETEPAA